MGFAKLLTNVETESRSGFDFKGIFLSPGALITEADLFPSAEFPEPAVLLEHAGPPHCPVRGHSRHKQGDVWILWRYRRGSGAWEELGRCCLPGTAWVYHMQPLAIMALAESRSPVPPLDEGALQRRIGAMLDAECAGLPEAQVQRVLAAVHDQLATRLCSSRFSAAA